jgi:hypothetical protein
MVKYSIVTYLKSNAYFNFQKQNMVLSALEINFWVLLKAFKYFL